MPVPACLTAPLPEITPPKLTASERLNAKVPLSVTLPAIAPKVPPPPICNVPAPIMVPPV